MILNPGHERPWAVTKGSGGMLKPERRWLAVVGDRQDAGEEAPFESIFSAVRDLQRVGIVVELSGKHL